MKLSIVIPIHIQLGDGDRLPLLRRTLQSLTVQTEKDFEVIVCNDASASQVEELCLEFTGTLNIRYMATSAMGEGAAFTRNRGIRVAKANRVLFIDCDCMADPGLVAAHVGIVGNYAMIGLRRHIAAADHRRLLTTDKLSKVPYRYEMRDTPKALAIIGDLVRSEHPEIAKYVFSCHVSFPTETLRAVGGFWEEMRGSGAEDQELALRCHRAGCRFLFMTQPVVYHQDHPQCLSQSGNIGANRKLLEQTQNHRDVIVRNGGRL